MADDERRAEIEAVAQALGDLCGDSRVDWVNRARVAVEAHNDWLAAQRELEKVDEAAAS